MMWTPATPGMVASSSISSTQMRWPSATGSAAVSSRAMIASGMIGAEQVLLHPARGFRRAQRRDADDQQEDRACLVPASRASVAAHDAGIHAELGLRELRAGRDLGRELGRLPVRRRIDRRVGGADEELRLAGDLACRSAARPGRAMRRARSVSVVESRSNTALASGWSPAFGSSPVSISRLWMPIAAAPIRSLCSAMRLRSRQVELQDRLDAGAAPGCAAAIGALMWARALAPSVTLTASARPRSGIGLRHAGRRGSNETGGAISAVMTKRPRPQRVFQSSRRSRARRGRWRSCSGPERADDGARRSRRAEARAYIRSARGSVNGAAERAGFLDRRRGARR